MTTSEPPGAAEPPADRPTVAPFVGALAIIVLVVVGIYALNAFGSSDATPDQLVRGAVVSQNAALQREDYADFVAFTCRAAQRSESDVLAEQRDSKAKGGARYVDEVTDIRIVGDRATAKATYHFEKTPDITSSVELTLAREDGAWKVCAP